MALDLSDMQARATEAGESVGKAHHRLRDLITEMYQQNSVTDYASPEHKAARKAFAEAAERGGTSKNSGMTLYARAYDSLIADGMPLQPRARKGAGGRKAQSASASDTSRESAGESAEAAKPLTNEEAIARARPMIAAESIRDFLSSTGLTYDNAKAAALAYAEGRQRMGDMPESAHGLIEDLLGAILDMGQRFENALKESDRALINVGHLPVNYGPTDLDASEPASEPEEQSASEPEEPAPEPAKTRRRKPKAKKKGAKPQAAAA